MNRAERRRKERQDKKNIKQEGDTQSFQMEMELMQPWGNFVMRTKLPPQIFDAMIKITDEIESFNKNGFVIFDKFLLEENIEILKNRFNDLFDGIDPAVAQNLKLVKDLYKSAAFSMSFGFPAGDSLMMDMTVYHDKFTGETQKTLPPEMLKLLPNEMSFGGALSLNAKYMHQLFMVDFPSFIIKSQGLEGQLDLKTAQNNLNQAFQLQYGVNLSDTLNNMPEAVLVAAPNFGGRFASIGSEIPDFLVGIQLN